MIQKLSTEMYQLVETVMEISYPRSSGILILVSITEKTCDFHPVSSGKLPESLKQIDLTPVQEQ